MMRLASSFGKKECRSTNFSVVNYGSTVSYKIEKRETYVWIMVTFCHSPVLRCAFVGLGRDINWRELHLSRDAKFFS